MTSPGGGGGGGVLGIYGIYIGGVCQKRVGLGAGTAQKEGLRCGYNHKKGVLGTSTTRKRGNLQLVL